MLFLIAGAAVAVYLFLLPAQLHVLGSSVDCGTPAVQGVLDGPSADTSTTVLESAIEGTRSGTERRARTTTVAVVGAAQNGTSGVLASGKHAGGRAAWATPRTGVMGYLSAPSHLGDPMGPRTEEGAEFVSYGRRSSGQLPLPNGPAALRSRVRDQRMPCQ